MHHFQLSAVYETGSKVDEPMGSSTRADNYSSSAPSEGSSAASTFESRFMLVAWTSAIRCLNLVPSTSSSTSRYRKVASRVMSCPFWRVLANLERFRQA